MEIERNDIMETNTETVEEQKIEVKEVDNKLVEEMMAEVESHARTSDLVRNPVIQGGDMPSVIHVQDEGLVDIYEKSTGRKVSVLRYMLAELLKAKENGETRFTTVPMEEKKRGKMKCLLHPDSENRARYDEMGFPTCRKSNLTSAYQVEQHMKRRHPTVWAAIEKERQDAKEQEQRDYQRAFMKQMAKAANKK